MSSLPARVSLTAALAAGTVASSAVPAIAVEGTAALDSRGFSRHAPAAPVSASVRVPTAPVSMTYQVQVGDSVWLIAQRTGTSVAAIVEANGLDRDALIRVGQMLTIPSPAAVPSPAVTSAPAPSAAAATHTVVRGDTLSHIAARHGTTVATLMSTNGLRSTLIHPGQVLRLTATAPAKPAPAPKPAAPAPAPAPTPAAATHTVVRGDTLSHIAARHGTTVATLMSTNGLRSTLIHPGQVLRLTATAPAKPAPAPKPAAPAPAPAPTPAAATHTVVRGDTLSHIAARHGTTVATLMSTNGLRSTLIHPGQVLRLTATAPTPAPQSAGTAPLVPSTFLHYSYPKATVDAANANKAALLAVGVPSREEMRSLVRSTATAMGVDPALALAIAMKESGFNHASVSPANAIGTMQVIPSSGVWASDLVGRELNLLDPRDNVTAGVAIIRQLVRTSSSLDIAIASYYQGAGSVKRNGMFSDTRSYVSGVRSFMTQFGG